MVNLSRFSKPARALVAGVGIVHQRFLLVEEFSIAENILLGLDRKARRKFPPAKLKQLLEEYGFTLNLSQMAGELSMGEKQCVEILKLLVREVNVLLFDEPTAVLPGPAIEVLFETLNRLRSRGKAIVFTSHKLDEVLLMADEITVMRKGKVVSEHLDAERIANPDQLATLMVGGDLPAVATDSCPPDCPERPANQIPVIELSNFTATVYDRYCPFQEVSFSILWGEIFCIVGVSGNGQEQLADAVAGVYPADFGKVRFQGETFAARDWRPKRFEVAYVPEDRHAMGTIPDMSLTENYLLTRHNLDSQGLLLDMTKARQRVRQGIESFAIAGATPETAAGSLSGGNLQKFLLFRELDHHAPLFVAATPTQGLDVLATTDIRNELLALKQKSAVLLFTSDLEEALLLADSIGVMFRGQLTLAVKDRKNRQNPEAVIQLRHHLGLLMAGARQNDSTHV